MDRRTFLKGAGAGAGLTILGARTATAGLPKLGGKGTPTGTPVKNVVIVMMENRSVDHYLGWYGAENPAFDGIQNASFPDLRAEGAPPVATQDWGAAGLGNYHGRHHPDPSHGWGGGRLERRGGTADGWLDPGTGNDEFALSYYGPDDVPVWSQLVRNWQAYDRWHCSVLGPTQPNRFYLHSAQSGGRKNNDLPPQVSDHPEWRFGWDWPTIWTLLDQKGISGAYYYSNLPQIAFWGHRHLNKARHVSEFYANCAAGTLPAVSIIDPWYSAPEGLANDDHPFADIRLGQQFLSDVVTAFTTSKQYQQGALVLTYDEWGGFWDHVPPPRVADDRGTPGDPGGQEDFGQIGFRIPSTIVSPWTRGGTVDHTTYEHSSILKFISDNWGLPYLNTRHAMTNSIGNAFRFGSTDLSVPFTPYKAPLGVVADATLDHASQGELPEVLPIGLPVDVPFEGSDLHRLAAIGWFDNLPVRIDYRFEDSFLSPPKALLAEATAALPTGRG